MSITIEPLTSKDVKLKAQLELDAFRDHPRMAMLWPNGYNAEYFAFMEGNTAASLEETNYKIFKAIDADGTMLGSAEWTLALDPVANAKKTPTAADAAPPKNWPTGGNWAMRLWYKRNMERLLREHMAGKPYLELNFLSIAPAAQGKGAGSKLLAWGIEVADREGAWMVLESTPTGFPLYRKYGFEQIEVINADMRQFGWTEPYDDATAVRIFMIREPQVRS